MEINHMIEHHLEQLKNHLKCNKSFFEDHELDSNQKWSLDLLAHGEYNLNFLFEQKELDKKLVIRMNLGSQMNLKDQLSYEYKTLKLLEASQRTARAYRHYLLQDTKGEKLEFFTMQYLAGRSLNYKHDLPTLAEILADIHSLHAPQHHLIVPKYAAHSLFSECQSMLNTYKRSHHANEDTLRQIERLQAKAQDALIVLKEEAFQPCIINTELNSGNFIISDKGAYLIDWEKPLFADPAQDLGHALAATTSFWKTDHILSIEEAQDCLGLYRQAVNKRINLHNFEKRTLAYITLNCLRGVTWCAMAYCQYCDKSKSLLDEDSFAKIKAYVDSDFIDYIIKNLP